MKPQTAAVGIVEAGVQVMQMLLDEYDLSAIAREDIERAQHWLEFAAAGIRDDVAAAA